MTHTYAVLDVSRAAYDEIRRKLDAAGYQHAFDGDVIDMHGIALAAPPRCESVSTMAKAILDDEVRCDLEQGHLGNHHGHQARDRNLMVVW